MVFVTLGTQDKTFVRLLEEIEKLIKQGKIQDEVLVQAGKTHFESSNMTIFDFADQKTLNQYVKQCSYMITHAGIGSIMNGINHQKKVIAVARRAKYGEHENDHQVEITTKFSNMGYILGCSEVSQLKEKLDELDHFQTKAYVSNQLAFCHLIESMIDDDK